MTRFIAALQHFSHLSELTQMSMILCVVILITGVLRLMKQPIIIGYLLAGMVVGPVALDLVATQDHSFVELFSHLGIALLLFMVGLGLNPKVIKEHGKTALGVGMIQIIGTAGLGLVISVFLGFDRVTAAYLAIGLTFSSTIVIVKLLSDKEESETIYGKIALGLLIVQDLVVMLLLMLVSILGQGGDGGVMILEGVMLILGLAAVTKWVLPKMMNWLAGSQEYLLLIGIGRCLLLGSLFWYVGFSFEIGCLLAGMSFALSPYRVEIANKLKSLRDFFIVLFFIHIGMQLQFAAVVEYMRAVVLFVGFVFVIKPLLVYGAVRWYGYTRNTALKAGMSIGQISEFSFLLIGMGIAAGHIPDDGLLSVVMFVGLATICLSSYVTIYNGKIRAWARKVFGEHIRPEDEEHKHWDETMGVDVVLFGYGRMGSHLSSILERNQMSYIVIDHNPAVIPLLEEKDIPYVFADATNTDVYKEILDKGVKMVISTIRDKDDDREIIHVAKKDHPEMMVVVTSNHLDEALDLYEKGADYVIMPDYISANHAGLMLEEVGFDLEKLLKKRKSHIELIEQHAKMGLMSLFRK